MFCEHGYEPLCFKQCKKNSLITDKILASRDGLYSTESVANWTYSISDVVVENRRWNKGACLSRVS